MKNVKFVWSQKCEEIFYLIKKLLTYSLILKIAVLEKDIVVCIETCIEGLGGVLVQEGYVIFYESRKLKEHEKNYSTHDLDLVDIVYGLKMWRHYLLGRIFELRTNHMSLKYLFC